MGCVTHTASFEEPAYTSGSIQSQANPEIRQRRSHQRRHSSYHRQPLWSFNHDDIPQLVDRFLGELGRRLDFLEDYGRPEIQIDLDSSIESAYSILHTVRESCSHVSDEVIGAGRRRAKILVDTLEERYKGALAKRQTMEQKVQEGVQLMEGILQDFEARVYAVRDSKFAGAPGALLRKGRRRVDSGIERAKGVVDVGFERARRAKDSLKNKVEIALNRAKEHGLIMYEDLPDPWRANPHIRKGYRFSETKIDCLCSIVKFSNEMVNIWSHLLGFILVLALALYIYPSSSNFSVSTKTDVLVAGVFFAAACKCLVCSTIWHTMNSISNVSLMERFACVDYTGISLLVATSIMTTEYTAFYCEPLSRWTYMTLTAVLGFCGTVLPWHPTFNRNDMAPARVAFYVMLGATGFIPVFQLSLTRGLFWAIYFYAPITKSLVVYLTGAFLYACQVPERWKPGAFDFFGGSHNIWHLAVIGGILFHYSAMQEFFRQAFERKGQEGFCSAY